MRTFKAKIVPLIFITTFVISVIITTYISYNVTENASTKYKNPVTESSKNEYVLKIHENRVALYNGDEIIKYYNINITLLPGKDIETLYNGIYVTDIAMADMMAEDFDG